MCRTTAYKSTSCGHRWLTITIRCAPNVGFTTTPVHEFRCDSSLLGRPNFMKAPAGNCPNCDKKGQYDGNTTRMVLGSGKREIQRNMLRGTGSGGGAMVVDGGFHDNSPGWRHPRQAQLAVQQSVMECGNTYGNYQQTLTYGRGIAYPVAPRYNYGPVRRAGEPSCNVM